MLTPPYTYGIIQDCLQLTLSLPVPVMPVICSAHGGFFGFLLFALGTVYVGTRHRLRVTLDCSSITSSDWVQGLATGWSPFPEVQRPECEAPDVPVCCHSFDSWRVQWYAPTAPLEDFFWGASLIFGEWSSPGATVATHFLVMSNF